MRKTAKALSSSILVLAGVLLPSSVALAGEPRAAPAVAPAPAGTPSSEAEAAAAAPAAEAAPPTAVKATAVPIADEPEKKATTPKSWIRFDHDALGSQIFGGAVNVIGGQAIATDIYIGERSNTTDGGPIAEFDIGPFFTFGDL